MSDTFGTVAPPPQTQALALATPSDDAPKRRRTRVTQSCLLRDKFFTELRENYNISQLRGQVQPAIQLYFVTVLAALGKRIGTMLELEGKKTITVESVEHAARFLYGVEGVNVNQFNVESSAAAEQRAKYKRDKPEGAPSKPPNKYAALHGKVHWKHFTDALKRATGVHKVRMRGSLHKTTFQGSDVVSKVDDAANAALACCLIMVEKFTDDLNKALRLETAASKSKTSAKGFFDRHLSVVVADPVHSHILGAAAVRVVPKRGKRAPPVDTGRRSTGGAKRKATRGGRR